MATQTKPYPSGGSWVTITKSASGCTAKSSTNITTLATPNQHLALHASNVWANSGGAGTHAARAQKVAHAQGIQLQEV
jgi:hypothetical protein